MKYYAVTEDPNELFHYGVKGMKWGQHIFGDKPKSPGYKRALGKLRASAKSAKSAVQKSATQHAINKQQRQQNKYNKAVQKAQRNNELVENLYNLDRVRVNERGIDRDYWGAAKIARIRDKQQQKIDRINNKRMIREAKDAVKYNKQELKMDKYMQQAREGKLKYGQLSDDQVQRLTNRLNMERNARQLGSAEKTWRQQKKEAFRKGKLSGIERGTAAAMEEVARAGTIYGIQNFMNRKKRNALAKQQGKEQRLKNREQNRKSAKDIREEVKQEAYESEVRSGKGFLDRSFGTHMTVGQAGKLLQENKSAEHERQRIQNVQDRLANERDEKFNEKYIDEYGFKNDDQAIDAHRNYLKTQASVATNKYGRSSDEAAEAKEKLKAFNNKSVEQQKREMLKLDASVEKKEEAKKNEAALDKYSEVRDVINKNKQIEQINNAKINAYEQRLKKWYTENAKTRGPRPSSPKLTALVPIPKLDSDIYDRLSAMNINIYQQQNGGGGNKNKNNKRG